MDRVMIDCDITDFFQRLNRSSDTHCNILKDDLSTEKLELPSFFCTTLAFALWRLIGAVALPA